MALRTITPNHRDLRQISISAYHLAILLAICDGREVEERAVGQWLELDRLLVQLWESYSIPLTILLWTPYKGETARELLGLLLPETTGGGRIDLFDDVFDAHTGHTAACINLY